MTLSSAAGKQKWKDSIFESCETFAVSFSSSFALLFLSLPAVSPPKAASRSAAISPVALHRQDLYLTLYKSPKSTRAMTSESFPSTTPQISSSHGQFTDGSGSAIGQPEDLLRASVSLSSISHPFQRFPVRQLKFVILGLSKAEEYHRSL